GRRRPAGCDTYHAAIAQEPYSGGDGCDADIHPPRIIRVLRGGLAGEVMVLASYRIREAALIKDGSLSGWPHLPVGRIHKLPKERAKSAVPIFALARNLQLASPRIVLYLDMPAIAPSIG